MRLEYYEHQLVSMGRPKEVACDIEYCSDSECDSAPMYRNGQTLDMLVGSRADWSRNGASLGDTESRPQSRPQGAIPNFLGQRQAKVLQNQVHDQGHLPLGPYSVRTHPQQHQLWICAGRIRLRPFNSQIETPKYSLARLLQQLGNDNWEGFVSGDMALGVGRLYRIKLRSASTA